MVQAWRTVHGVAMVRQTYERERLGQSRHVADHVAVGKVPVDVVLADLVELSYEAVNGLSLRLTLLDRQAHGEEIFQDVIQKRRHVLVNLKRRSFGCKPASGVLQGKKERILFPLRVFFVFTSQPT